MDVSPRSNGRLGVALVLLALLALAVWRTMAPSRFRSLAWLMLGFSAFRMMMLRFRSRYSGDSSLLRRME